MTNVRVLCLIMLLTGGTILVGCSSSDGDLKPASARQLAAGSDEAPKAAQDHDVVLEPIVEAARISAHTHMAEETVIQLAIRTKGVNPMLDYEFIALPVDAYGDVAGEAAEVKSSFDVTMERVESKAYILVKVTPADDSWDDVKNSLIEYRFYVDGGSGKRYGYVQGFFKTIEE